MLKVREGGAIGITITVVIGIIIISIEIKITIIIIVTIIKIEILTYYVKSVMINCLPTIPIQIARNALIA
jgi:hypothetical protein